MEFEEKDWRNNFEVLPTYFKIPWFDSSTSVGWDFY